MLNLFLPAWEAGLGAIALRVLLAGVLSFLVSLMLGRFTIRWLISRSVQDGEARKASETLNKINKGKATVPTMGGIFILASIAIGSLLLLPFDSSAIGAWAVVGTMLALGALGLIDDWTKLTRSDRDGISGKFKLAWQVLVAGSACTLIALFTPEASQSLLIPSTGYSIPLGMAMVPLGIFVVVGSSNAVNLTDGLDGLAAGTSIMVSLALALGALAIAIPGVAEALGLPVLVAGMPVAIVAVLIAGACAGFLWFNSHPAQVFMGDTGSLALGGGLGMIAVASRMELLLAIAGIVFVAEAASVMLQVGCFKLTKGKRLFRCAPLHHHFQFSGWKETKVTQRFWMLSALACVAALGLLALPGFAHLDRASESQPIQADAEKTAPVEPDLVVAR